MLIHFYDIESLSNVFMLANEIHEDNHIDVYYLCDDPMLTAHDDLQTLVEQRVHEKNKNFDGTVSLWDLRFEEANRKMAIEFGLSDAYSINDPASPSSYPKEFRLVCDTDPEYSNEIHPYLSGYNSYNYDTTMLAEYFNTTWLERKKGATFEFKPTSAKYMREYNNELFTSRFKDNMPSRLACVRTPGGSYSQPDYKARQWKIRKNMMLSGRHIDVARLNEKQSKVGLKRLLGMLGYQILESDKLKQGQDTIENLDQFLDLIAYNVSDIVNLRMLFNHPLYQGQFALKKGLLDTYPELIYDKKYSEYAPEISPKTVRRDRLFIDSSSAQLATKALCPYDHLSDLPVVSFMYPSERKAKELGVKQVNVLEESKKFFYSKFPQPELRAKFDSIYEYYKRIEGRNFNESDNYAEDFTTDPDDPDYHPAESLANEPKINMNMFYYNADGTPSNCFVNFSTGGIHGAEYNKTLFEKDMLEWEIFARKMQYVKALYPDPIDCRKAKEILMPDGTFEPYKTFLKSGATLKEAHYRDVESMKPLLFKDDKKGNWKLNAKYAYTSAAHANHEDFTSYYPNMLRMMSAFYNPGLGYDRYAEIFDNKQKYGKLMKDKSLSEADRYHYSILREGTKLILNSASGAGDATFESNIRMNNRIISMRIIGQLFTWRIGQAQTIEGAQIISTNTDGLYSVLEASINDPILARESADIGVEIEPEPLYLISKDSNNRIEMEDDIVDIISASGGTLACRQGPAPTKALAHPAIIDWAMTEYLIVSSTNYKNTSLSKQFDDTIGRSILEQSIVRISQEIDKSTNGPKGKREVLRMFQNVLASSPSSQTYVFGTTDENPDTPIIMQHYNRVFIMKDGTPNTIHLHSAHAKKLTDSTINKRKKENERAQQHDPIASFVLDANGENVAKMDLMHEAAVQKISGIEESWSMLVLNQSLFELTDSEIEYILNNIDFDKYLGLLHSGFEENWMNNLPTEDEIPEAPITPKSAKQTKHITIIRENEDPMEFDISNLNMLEQFPHMLATM